MLLYSFSNLEVLLPPYLQSSKAVVLASLCSSEFSEEPVIRMKLKLPLANDGEAADQIWDFEVPLPKNSCVDLHDHWSIIMVGWKWHRSSDVTTSWPGWDGGSLGVRVEYPENVILVGKPGMNFNYCEVPTPHTCKPMCIDWGVCCCGC